MIGDYFSQLYRDQGTPLGQAFAEGMAAHKTIGNAMAETVANLNDQSPEISPSPMNSSANTTNKMNTQNSSLSAILSEEKAASRGAPMPKSYSDFGKQLGKLMNRDHSIQIAFTDFGGWDTHINQGNGKGQLANRLQPLASGLSELAYALGPLYSKTTIIVMSEFGRTIKENGNLGTDHGHGNVIWLLGGTISGGKIYGRWSDLTPNNLYEGRDLPATTDFRDVLCYVLSNHLAISKKSLSYIFPDFNMSAKPLVS